VLTELKGHVWLEKRDQDAWEFHESSWCPPQVSHRESSPTPKLAFNSSFGFVGSMHQELPAFFNAKTVFQDALETGETIL
jgi:hypothetical protein